MLLKYLKSYICNSVAELRINLFKKQYSVIYQKRVSESYEMPLEDIKIFADMTPLLFHVDKTEIDFKKLKTLTIDAEIFVGSL